jgi:hypothetical protein
MAAAWTGPDLGHLTHEAAIPATASQLWPFSFVGAIQLQLGAGPLFTEEHLPMSAATTRRATADTRAQIPLPLVRANQWTLVLTVLVAALTRQPAILLLPWAITIAGLAGGPRWQPVFRIARRAFSARLATAPREDAAAQRFNALLAGTLLTLALAAFLLLRTTIPTWICAGAVAMAAFLATRGFCVGCALYGYLPPSLRRILAGGVKE